MDLRRTARLRIDIAEVLQGRDLPEGTRVRGIEARQDPHGFDVILEHPDLLPVEPSVESPWLSVLVDPDGPVQYIQRDGTRWGQS